MNRTCIRFCLAQINPIVGDLKGNTEKILSCMRLAEKAEADIIIFPELALCGYPPEDLLFSESFIKKNREYLNTIIQSVSSLCVIIGFPARVGKLLYNAAGVITRKKLIYIYKKVFLPNYGVFDEKRYFAAGQEYPILQLPGGMRVGITICEDIWHINGPHTVQTKSGKAHAVVTLSASPYHARKILLRTALLQQHARKTKAYYLYCNMVGGQDELVFDGASFAVDSAGQIIARARQFEEDMLYVDIPMPSYSRTSRQFKKSLRGVVCTHIKKTDPFLQLSKKETLYTPCAEVYQALILGLRDYLRKNNFKKAVLGLSGGIDSALVAAIAVDALGKNNVIAISMPSPYSSRETKQDARILAENLGIQFREISIQPILSEYLKILKKHFKGCKPDITEENIQARIRGNILMAFSNKYRWIVLTTGNKSEVSVGYCTLYGDMAGGFAVLKDIPKTFVYKLSLYRNTIQAQPIIPRSIIRRAPSAELKPNQKDQDALPAYDVLDKVLEEYIEKRKDASAIHVAGLNKIDMAAIINLIDTQEYKRRQSPPGIKITPLAFGKDRRMPITFRKS